MIPSHPVRPLAPDALIMPRIAAINQDRGISPDRNKGAAVHLAAMRDAFAALGSEVEAMDMPDDASLAATLASHHRRRPFDLLYERYAIGKSCAAHFSRDHGIPLVLEVNAPLADEQKLFRAGTESDHDRDHDQFLFQQAARIVAVSNPVADYALKRGASPDSVMVCPNGIDTARFNMKIDASETRRKLDIERSFVLGFHGRVRPWHGFDQLVAVFHRLLDEGLPVHLLVVGEGKFEELAGLPPGSYTRVGWQPHASMPAWVAAFDALPLTYQPDMPCYFSPLKLMEAMACGVVPLVPDLGDLASAVEHGRTGLVYTAGDNEGLVSQLRKLVLDKEHQQELGRNAAAQARQHSWIAIAENILNQTLGTAIHDSTGTDES